MYACHCMSIKTRSSASAAYMYFCFLRRVRALWPFHLHILAFVNQFNLSPQNLKTQVGAVRVDDADLREASEEQRYAASAAGLVTPTSHSYMQSMDSMEKVAAEGAAERLLLDEEVFLSQLYRRARLLNGMPLPVVQSLCSVVVHIDFH